MKFKPYAQYKPSGVEWLGDAPMQWSLLAGRRVFIEQRLPALPSDQQLTASQKYGVIPQADFMRLEDQKVMLALTGTGNFKHVDKNNFVISLRSFEGGLELSRYDGCVSPAYTVLAPAIPSHPDFFRYLFKCRPYISALQAGSEGIRDGRTIRYDQFAGITLPLPDLSNQAVIATFLDRETAKIDTLIAKQEKLIELLQEKRQALISHAVTKGLDSTVPMKPSGVEWLGDVPAHWDIGSLKRFWGVTDCKHITAEFVEDGFPLASIREVQSRYVELMNAKQTTEAYYEQLIEGGRKPLPGDLIFSRNATVGEVAQVANWHPPFAMGQDVCLLRRGDPGISSDFLQYVIRSLVVTEQLQTLMIGSTFKRVNVEEIRNLIIPMPDSDEQYAIVAHLDGVTARIDTLIAKAQQAIELQKEHRTALISAAVTGKIDVRGLVDRDAYEEKAA